MARNQQEYVFKRGIIELCKRAYKEGILQDSGLPIRFDCTRTYADILKLQTPKDAMINLLKNIE